MKLYITLKIKSYGCTNDDTITEVIYDGSDKEEAKNTIKSNFEELVENVESDNYELDENDIENSYIIDDEEDCIYTYAIHEINVKEKVSIYEVSYTVFNPGWGNCNSVKYVRAENEAEALKIANKLIHNNIDDIKVIGKLETIN